MSKIRFVAPFALLACSALACSGADNDDGNSQEDDVVKIYGTPVPNQAIGNCWIYAGTTWAEALHLNYSGNEINISESWLTFADLYHGVLDGAIGDDGVQTGGWFGEAMDWIARYGVFDEARFRPGDEKLVTATIQKSALTKINAALKDPAFDRRDREAVRKLFDEAFEISPEIIEIIDNTFGRHLERDFTKGATIPAGTEGLYKPSDIGVGWSYTDDREVSLGDAVGTARSAYNQRTRQGKFAWNEQNYPSGTTPRRDFLRKMQEVLHNRVPVPMSWFVDFNARKNGEFRTAPDSPGSQGGHVSVVMDYKVNNVPGFGTLEAGVEITDSAMLTAALDKDASIEFLRIKNTWGVNSPNLPNEFERDLRGYNDLYLDYLNARITTCDSKDSSGKCISGRNGFTGAAFPPVSWNDVGPKPAPAPEPDEPGAQCVHSLCAAGEKLDPVCDPCAEVIIEVDPYCGSTAWDGLCISQAKEWCDLVCE